MRILIVISLMFGIYSNVHCQKNQDNDGDLKTVYKTLRTPAFNQAWENYKSTDANNPYDQIVDDLYTQNSSVATYVKDITKKMRTRVIQPISNPQSEEFLNQKMASVSEPQIIYDDAITKKQFANISDTLSDALKRINYCQDVYIKTSPNNVDMPLAETAYKVEVKDGSIHCKNTSITINPKLLAILQEGHFFYVIKEAGLWPKSKIQDKYLLPVILHEIAHLRYWPRHGFGQYCYPDLQLSRVREYEADWYWARKNKHYASLLEIFYLRSKQMINAPADTHPSDQDRCKSLKEIRRLKEAESRWLWGPKGYEKYGDPAYEKAFIKWSEKQNKLS